jgi:hypothetical protein
MQGTRSPPARDLDHAFGAKPVVQTPATPEVPPQIVQLRPLIKGSWLESEPIVHAIGFSLTARRFHAESITAPR